MKAQRTKNILTKFVFTFPKTAKIEPQTVWAKDEQDAKDQISSYLKMKLLPEGTKIKK